jgi:hypothetical protein
VLVPATGPLGGTVAVGGVAVAAGGAVLVGSSTIALGQTFSEMVDYFQKPNDYGEKIAGSNTSDLKPPELMDELAKSGVKYNPDDVVVVTKTPEGKLVWLEKGNPEAGLQHIIDNHAIDFARRGVAKNQLPELLAKALQEEKVVGTQNTRPVYELIFNGKAQKVAITVAKNGFIVGANPAS